ncbi:hypothetical protein [Streptomyces longisporoflavus]|uniref:Uncharacterized protein n=1 Tax=Streptomyces longisporoflavus TaxID=28044 RepID=A0ABW7QQH8_9ACTN
MTSNAEHLTQPDLARITVHAGTADTAIAVAYEIAGRLDATGPSQPHPAVGEEGVAVELYAYAPPPPNRA